MADKYSKFGPAPRTPSCMQRSCLLSIDFKVTSLTEWVAQLKMNPLYAILSGFEVGNTPGVGTFYDFLNRLWDSDDYHMSPHIHPLKTKVKKPKTKGTRADSVEKVTVADLLPSLEKTDFKFNEQPYSSLFKIYQKEFLEISVSTGLIHADALALAGDGTPVVTSHRERKNVSANVKRMVSMTVIVNAIFPSLIVISDGIPLGIVIIKDMICTCLLTHKVTCLYSLIFPVHQNMIHMDSCMLFSG